MTHSNTNIEKLLYLEYHNITLRKRQYERKESDPIWTRKDLRMPQQSICMFQ